MSIETFVSDRYLTTVHDVEQWTSSQISRGADILREQGCVDSVQAEREQVDERVMVTGAVQPTGIILRVSSHLPSEEFWGVHHGEQEVLLQGQSGLANPTPAG